MRAQAVPPSLRLPLRDPGAAGVTMTIRLARIRLRSLAGDCGTAVITPHRPCPAPSHTAKLAAACATAIPPPCVWSRLSAEQWIGPYLPIVQSGRCGETGHVAWFLERWVLRRSGAPSMLARADTLYARAASPMSARCFLPLPSPEDTLAYLARFTNAVLQAVGSGSAVRDRGTLLTSKLSLYHQDCQQRGVRYIAPDLGYEDSPGPRHTDQRRSRVTRSMPSGDASRGRGGGTRGRGAIEVFVFDNEKWGHCRCRFRLFAIARRAVSNRRFPSAFVEDGQGIVRANCGDGPRLAGLCEDTVPGTALLAVRRAAANGVLAAGSLGIRLARDARSAPTRPKQYLPLGGRACRRRRNGSAQAATARTRRAGPSRIPGVRACRMHSCQSRMASPCGPAPAPPGIRHGVPSKIGGQMCGMGDGSRYSILFGHCRDPYEDYSRPGSAPTGVLAAVPSFRHPSRDWPRLAFTATSLLRDRAERVLRFSTCGPREARHVPAAIPCAG